MQVYKDMAGPEQRRRELAERVLSAVHGGHAAAVRGASAGPAASPVRLHRPLPAHD